MIVNLQPSKTSVLHCLLLRTESTTKWTTLTCLTTMRKQLKHVGNNYGDYLATTAKLLDRNFPPFNPIYIDACFKILPPILWNSKKGVFHFWGFPKFPWVMKKTRGKLSPNDSPGSLFQIFEKFLMFYEIIEFYCFRWCPVMTNPIPSKNYV